MKQMQDTISDRERRIYRQEAIDRMRDRPAFDPFLGQGWLAGKDLERIMLG